MNITLFYILNTFGHAHPSIGNVALFIATTGSTLVFIAALVYIFFCPNPEHRNMPLGRMFARIRETSIVLFSTAMAWVLGSLIKELFHADRPFIRFQDVHNLIPSESYYSFPSNHATFFAALAVAIYFVNKKAGIIFGLCALLIGISRVVVGVHFPVDVVGGWILGSLTSYLFYRLFKKIY